jgi:hypothetical protein
MGVDRAACASSCTGRAPACAAPHGVKWHLLGAAQRCPVARSARTLRALAVGVSPLQRLAPRGRVRAGSGSDAGPARCGGPDRLGSLACGRHDGAGVALGRWDREKGGGDEPADHALGRSRGGFGSKLHLVADGHGLPLAVHVTAGQIHECTQFEEVMNRVRSRWRQGLQLHRDPRVAA